MKARYRTWIWLPIVASLLSLGACRPIEYYMSQVYKVHGRVTIAGTSPPTPIGSAEVIVGDYHYSELTNYFGDYEMEMAEGSWTINIRKDGFESVTEVITVGPGNPRERLDVEMVWIEPPMPADLTGWWDVFFLLGDDIIGPEAFYIEQNGPDLKCSHDFVGSVDGPEVTVTGEFPWEEVGTATGTASEDLIEVSYVSSVVGEVGLRFMRPHTTPFGHFDFQGDVEGVSVSLDTEYAIGEGGQPESQYRHLLQFDYGSVISGIEFLTAAPLSPLTSYTVTEDDVEEDDQINASVWSNNMWFPGVGGTINIATYDANGMSGDFHLKFDDGSYLDAPFDVVFGASTNAVSLTGWWWSAPFGQDSTAVYVETSVSTSTSFDVVFQDHESDMRVQFGVDGIIEADKTYTIDQGAKFWTRWQPQHTGGLEYSQEATTGSLTILEYTPETIKGTYAFDQPSGPKGSFDVTLMQSPF